MMANRNAKVVNHKTTIIESIFIIYAHKLTISLCKPKIWKTFCQAVHIYIYTLWNSLQLYWYAYTSYNTYLFTGISQVSPFSHSGLVWGRDYIHTDLRYNSKLIKIL